MIILKKTKFSKNVFALLLTSLFVMLHWSCSKETASISASPQHTVLETPTVTLPNFVSAAAIIDSMGTGFNLGNTFDYNLQNSDPTTIYPIIDMYYDAGFRHIRIPVTWMDGFNGNHVANGSGIINFQHPRFIQLKAAIDYAIGKKMFVVINTHHEEWLNKNYNGSAQYDSNFTNLWTGIATYFKDYSYLLIFEILNEPHGVFGDWNGGANPFSGTALNLTRKINKVGYDAIRNTGGQNADRVIMVSTNGMGSHTLLDEMYPSKASLPGGGLDQYLAIHVHSYDPWAFCGPTGSNTAWPGSNAISNPIIALANYANTLNVAVNLGEFAVGRETNVSERNTDLVRGYYRTMRLTCLSNKIAPTVWDDRGWYGLVDQSGSNFLYNIVPYMMATEHTLKL